MKDTIYRIGKLFAIMLSLGLFMFVVESCDDNTNTPSSTSGPVFLVGCKGSGDTIPAGLYKMTNSKKGPSFEFITGFAPWNMSLTNVDMNNGRIAMRVDVSLVPEGESGVAYMDTDNLKDIKWAPIPKAPIDNWYAIDNVRPRVLPDGKIAYRVTLQTDNQYDDAHWGMLAIYDPVTDEIELSGACGDFVLSQPEQGSDTEAGSMSEFLVSADGKYAYVKMYGFGTNMGVYHVDYKFVARYEIGKPGSYTRIAQTSDIILAITADGKHLILQGDGLQRIDVGTLYKEKIDDKNTNFYAGQVSTKSSSMLKMWRGSGLAAFDMGTTPVGYTPIIDGSALTGSYRGLGHGAQYSADEQKIYFTASTDYYTNYKTDLLLFSTPIMENNIAPDSITTIPVQYCTGFFLLLK